MVATRSGGPSGAWESQSSVQISTVGLGRCGGEPVAADSGADGLVDAPCVLGCAQEAVIEEQKSMLEFSLQRQQNAERARILAQ